MSRTASSQWDFRGELFENTRRVFSVSGPTSDIRRLLERSLGQIWVSGEILCRAKVPATFISRSKTPGRKSVACSFAAIRSAVEAGRKTAKR